MANFPLWKRILVLGICVLGIVILLPNFFYARVERAMELLGDDIPEHLRYAGELRLAHRDASLDELGHHADPPMTKDAVAGRIRRLLAMADKRAAELGVPGTEASLPADLDV